MPRPPPEDVLPVPGQKPPRRPKKSRPPQERLPEESEPLEGARKPMLPPSLARFQPREAATVSLEDYNALRELLSPGVSDDELDARSDVNTLQIIHFARARSMSDHFNIPSLRNFVTDFLRLSLSKDRKSRSEFVRAFQSANMGETEAQAGILNRLQGKLRG